MAEPSKDELVKEARGVGIDPSGLTKPQLEDRLEARAPAELGPVVPEGELKPEPPKASGSPIKGVQPLEESDIPDAGR